MIEAVPERMEIKQAVFAELDAVTPGHAILASNTSSLSITEMAEATTRPDKVVRLPLLLPRVDDAADRGHRGRGDLRGDRCRRPPTSPSRSARQPIRCGEAPGFVVNRILNSAVSEIWRVAEEEGLDVKEVDKIVQESKAPRRWARSSSPTCSGLDTVLHVAEHLQESLRRPLLRLAKMKELVEAGNLGQKTGKGFYEHGTDQTDATGTLVERFTLKTLVESCLVLEEGVAAPRTSRSG